MIDLLTTKQAADKKDVSVRSIQQYIKTGQLYAERNGRDWLIWPADLDALKVAPVGYPKGRSRRPQA